eukprot:CAMPEP_0182478292 /NCGR_PEP_ID=MMETSP1319-20130603/32274_1 /TAXON_ID=172717 /ORGANISM="Bolidomonas pacifica, Strain RCC208" /LENGTH=233 /DNA_ID=CAMNT_0024679615 /DNA_START=179 /DNA_END=876 /DNA_ORIENTATION=-
MSSLPPRLLSRLRSDLAPFTTSPPPGCTLTPTDNPLILKATLTGPHSTPFEGGLWHLTLTLPTTYPFNPPTVRFDTSIVHPNISPTGLICLSTLKPRPAGTWSPAMTLYALMTQVRVLVGEPNWEDGLEQDVVEMYRGGRWEGEARAATRKHAMAEDGADDDDDDKANDANDDDNADDNTTAVTTPTALTTRADGRDKENDVSLAANTSTTAKKEAEATATDERPAKKAKVGG